MVMSIRSVGTPGFTGIEAAQAKQKDAINKLSSGLRINKAADDAAGLSLGTAIQTQLRSLNSASMNGQNAVSLLQTADGGLDQTSKQLQRVRELTIQAAGTSDQGALSALSNEVDQSLQEIDRISQTTVFGSQNLLNGSLSAGAKFHVGTSDAAHAEVNVAIPNSSQGTLGLGGLSAAIKGGGAGGAISSIDDAIKNVGSTRTTIGAATNALGNAVSAIGTEMLNATGANSRIMDADYAQTIISGSSARIQSEAGIKQLRASADNATSLLGLLRS